MGLLDFFNSKSKSEPKQEPENNIIEHQPESGIYGGQMGGGWYGGMPPPVIVNYWNGEKTPGELGAILKNIPDYYALRLRAYDAYTKTDVIKILTSKRIQWVVGQGLKLEAEPNQRILGYEYISIPSNFQEKVEARWTVWANSVYGDYEKRRSIHELAKDFYSDKFKGGDCLCIVRFEDIGMTVQFVSGEHIKTPITPKEKLKEGHTIDQGVETNEKGEHVAYHICKRSKTDLFGEFERIEAVGTKTKLTMAWMIYGQKISSDHKRGVPEFSQILEKVSKLDRYSEAMVSKAEQAANILFTIEHTENAIGDNPLVDHLSNKLNKNKGIEAIDSNKIADGIANTITQTTSNQAINLPPGAKMVPHVSDNESHYKEFFEANFNTISASVDTPPEVALQMYNSNYSASRAAINGWGYVVDIDRNDFSNQFYKRVYKLWFIVEVLKNKIEAPGFLKALQTNDFMIIESYIQCRFTGKNMPHIDPLKEIKAIREAMGDDRTPLISREQAAEMGNYGDWEENYLENLEETKIIKTPENDTEESTVSK